MSARVVVLLLVTLCSLLACGGEAEDAAEEGPLRVDVEVSRSESLADPVLVSAVLEAGRWQALYFQQGGIIARILVEEGARVRADDLLAELDVTAQYNRVAQAANRVEGSQLDHVKSVHKYDQSQSMAGSGAVSPEQVRDREQQVAQTTNQLTQSQLSFQSEQIRLEGMRIYAPFDGLIAELNIRVGDKITSSVADPDAKIGIRPPLVIIDPSGFELRAALPEGQALDLEAGLPARVTLMEDRSRVLDGQVVWVAPSVDRESRTVAFRVEVDVAQGARPAWLRDGSTVLVEVLSNARDAAVTLSEGALVYFDGQASVFTTTPSGRVRQVAVAQGAVRDGRVEILSGLEAGVTVVTSHVGEMEDGRPIQIGRVVEGTP